VKRIILALCLVASTALAANFRTGQESVGTGSAVEVGDTANRGSLTIHNDDSSNPIFCGKSTVSSSNGLKIPAGSAFTFDSNYGGRAAGLSVYCIATGGTVTASYWESTSE
jgi:hypothetical protein